MRIFLSGAIQDVPDLPASWRFGVEELLPDYEIIHSLVNPIEQVFKEPNEVVRRNELLQKSCDLLLVEYSIPNRCYVGTDYELVRAHDWHQPAIVWAHEMYRSRVYLRYLATVILPSLEDAVDYIKAYYPPDTLKRKG